jgi:hypothetical protein
VWRTFGAPWGSKAGLGPAKRPGVFCSVLNWKGKASFGPGFVTGCSYRALVRHLIKTCVDGAKRAKKVLIKICKYRFFVLKQVYHAEL